LGVRVQWSSSSTPSNNNLIVHRMKGRSCALLQEPGIPIMKNDKDVSEKSFSFWSIQKARWVRISRQIPFADVLIVGIGVLLAFCLRYSLRGFQSLDLTNFQSVWYVTIREQGFAAFRSGFSNYPPLFLYLYYIVSVILPTAAVTTAVKLPAIACDFICAWYVYRIIRLKYEQGPVPIFAFLAILFTPTVVLNSAAWSQIESIYTAALLACLYYLLKKQNWAACIAFGIAFSIKLQSIYLAPLLLVLFLKKQVSWKQLLVIPAVYLITIMPAWAAGRPLTELLTIYTSQVSGYTGLVHNAPNMYTWLPADMSDMFSPAGVIFAASICLMYAAVIMKSHVPLSKHILVQLAFLSVLLVPYFLPKTHDRYFYPSDVFSIVYGFFFPGYFYLPLAANLISFFIYQPFLFGRDIFPQPVLALALLVVIFLAVRHAILNLYKPGETPLE
jgi:Gpi18-like mannosyltransferase